MNKVKKSQNRLNMKQEVKETKKFHTYLTVLFLSVITYDLFLNNFDLNADVCQ